MDCALNDKSLRVRRIAVNALGGLPFDAQINKALQVILKRETDAILIARAHNALQQHVPLPAPK